MKINITGYELKDVIRTICELSGLTQEEFDQMVCNCEGGQLRYTFDALVKIADKHGLIIAFEK